MNYSSLWYSILFISVSLFIYIGLKQNTKDMLVSNSIPFWAELLLPISGALTKNVGAFLEKLPVRWNRWLNRRCLDAGLPWSAADVYSLQIVCCIISVSIVVFIWVFTGMPFIFLLPLLLSLLFISLAFPVFYVHTRQTKRLDEISRVLPFAIDLISSAMNAGLDFQGSIRYYNSLNYHDSLSLEFRYLLQEIELGKTRLDALRDMERRVHSEDFSRFISQVIYSLESGTAVIDVMLLQSDEIRRIRFAKVEQQIAKVPSKMLVPIVLFIVPGIFVIVLTPLVMKLSDLGIIKNMFH